MKTTYGYDNTKAPLFELPKTPTDLEKSMEKLVEPKYHSFYAEKRRWFVLKSKIPIWSDKNIEKERFIKVVESYFYAINSKTRAMESINQKYFITKGGRINKALFDDEALSFSCNYVMKDVLYTDTFDIIQNRNGKRYLYIKRQICSPFTLEIWSFKAIRAKQTFKRSFKLYAESIKVGV